jgi:hypothetical protein
VVDAEEQERKMIRNKYNYKNRHSREGCEWVAATPPGTHRPTPCGCGNPVGESKIIFIVILLLTPLVFANSTQAGSLGRLFFTPEQRAQFEHERTTVATHKEIAATPNATDEDEPSPSVLTVSGIVQKKGGGRTVWINGKAQNAGNSDEHNPESLPVSVPGKSHPVKVKVGQKIILEQPAQPKPPAPVPQKPPVPTPKKEQPAEDD